MALTFTRVGDVGYHIFGNMKVTVTDVLMDDSYLSGGETVTPANLGLNRVEFAVATPNLSATTTVNVAFAGYDQSTNLLHVYNETPAEVTSTNDLAGAVIRVMAFGY